MLGGLYWGAQCHKGYTKRSYFVGTVHEGFALPAVLAIGLAESSGSGLSFREWAEEPFSTYTETIHIMLIAYLVGDIIANLRASPEFGTSLLVHHALSISIAVLSLAGIQAGAGYAAMAIVLPELGSLWLNIADVWPSPPVFLLRFFFYTSSRIVSAYFAYELVLLMTDLTSQIILTSLTMLLLVHNGRVAHHMGKRIFKDLRDKQQTKVAKSK
eukprot:CAMPEP_0119542478 /NCGR_PEP_ID=MMETSP1344-20130328/53604_1 /TAXON_ID=236787 /ORGANISM="Florenciella parvula, Strain CCMP2471" /LENGTH=213 /DNA_ID=CAMNT_0007586699 /DNA_START=227 /DNA_END=868 /DNA_ORIENTATION=-